MDFFHSVEFYVLALFVAFALMGIIVSPRLRGAATTVMAAMTLEPHSAAEAAGTIVLTCRGDGAVQVTHHGISAHEGDSLFLTVTVIDDKMTLIEKRGAAGSGTATVADAHAVVEGLPSRRMHVRYESEVTGQWGLLTLTNADGNTVSATLRY